MFSGGGPSLPLGSDQSSPQPNTSVVVLAENLRRYRVVFVNDSDTVIYIKKGDGAGANVGIRLNALGGCYVEEMHMHNGRGIMYTGIWTAYSGAASKILQIMEDSL